MTILEKLRKIIYCLEKETIEKTYLFHVIIIENSKKGEGEIFIFKNTREMIARCFFVDRNIRENFITVKILVATVIWHLYRAMASKVSKSTRRQTRRATLIILRGTIQPFFCLIFILILRTIFHRTRQKEPFEYSALFWWSISRGKNFNFRDWFGKTRISV